MPSAFSTASASLEKEAATASARVFSEKELALHYNSRDALLSDPRLRTFVEWLSSKPAGFVPRH